MAAVGQASLGPNTNTNRHTNTEPNTTIGRHTNTDINANTMQI